VAGAWLNFSKTRDPARPACQGAGVRADVKSISRRVAVGACVAAPIGVAMAIGRGARSVMVGGRDFADARVEPGAFPKRLVGPDGAARMLPAAPRRIVSTFLGADELLASLVDPRRVVAISAYADDAATSNCLGVFPPNVPRLRTDPETILSLDPDLVFVAGFTGAEALRPLVAAGVTVVRWSRFESFPDIVDEIRMAGAAVGEEARAAALAGGVNGRLATVASRLAGVRPKRVLYYDPPTYTMGRGTLVGEILQRAGAANVAEALGIVGPGEIGLEMVLALDPEAIVMPRYADNVSALATLQETPVWREVPAVRAGQVHEIPGAWIATVSHHAARGLERVAQRLHPEAFAPG
jgi:iron complex transport system substrate-binding protein